MSFVHLEQRINGIPAFRGEVKAGFTQRNEIVRVINNLAPGLNYSEVSTNFGDPASAVNRITVLTFKGKAARGAVFFSPS